MNRFEAAREEQQRAAAERIGARGQERGEKIDAIRSGHLAEADTPERVASRIDRLTHYYADVRPISPGALVADRAGAKRSADAVLERVINTPDFVDVRYLAAGDVAARAVGRVDIHDQGGRLIGYGTGSLVAPRLLLTNHHVLPDKETAAASSVEFNYEDGLDGRPMQPVVLQLDPNTFFRNDQELDFALVAVAGSEDALRSFGSNPLIGAEGKAIAGDFVTIVQHPRGEKKQVALRDNRIVDVLDDFLHYQTDTEPGSSGSPVFNDQWEVVALHHASVEDHEHTELGGFVNEGIRISRLLKYLHEQNYTPAEKALIDTVTRPELVTIPAATNGSPAASAAIAASGRTAPGANGDVTIPLEVSVRVTGARRSAAGAAPSAIDEAIQIDPNYGDRPGYDPEFLGSESSVPLPTLAPGLVALAATSEQTTGEPKYVLPYYHFSIVMNKERRLAFFTAVNIDGSSSRRLKREQDHWYYDQRLSEEEQTGPKAYEHNDLDLGHLVRRLDPTWGRTEGIAKLANDDTFHYTNCTPQHKDFNRSQLRWAGLEDYILEHADNLMFKVDVFTGPVLADDDQDYRTVKLPRQFWKVVSMVKSDGDLSATAYLVSQEDLIKGLEVDLEDFSYADYRTFQVPIRKIEALTQLSFGSLADADPLAQKEALVEVKELTQFEDIEL
jgi:endonuclease G